MREDIGKNKEDLLALQRFLNCIINKRESLEIKATFGDLHWPRLEYNNLEKFIIFPF